MKRYKPFTGLDEPVIRFLEEDGEIFPFLEHAYALVDASVNDIWSEGSATCLYASAVPDNTGRSIRPNIQLSI